MEGTVRELQHVGESALLGIAKAVPEKRASILRELLIRADQSKSAQDNAKSAIESNDEGAILARLYSVIGEICTIDYLSLSFKDRCWWKWQAMTEREKTALIDALRRAVETPGDAE